MKWYFVAVLLTVLTSSQGILTTLSQTKGRYLYDYATVPFLAELYKLVVSASLLWRESRISQPTRITTEWKTVRLYPIPSIIYLIHNNVQFATLTYVDTSTYQIMGNLKIVTTGILFRFGVIFNMAKLIVDDFQSGFEKGPWWQRLFNGYSITTWLVVLNLGSTGLLVSWLMKYADNIVKVYSTSMAMLLTMVLSVFLFSFKPTLQLFLGIVICMMSLHMYFAPPNKLVDLPAPIKPAPEALKEVSIDRSTES
ncbi:CMP-sialic acid transporter 1 [Linum grandiflorum]